MIDARPVQPAPPPAYTAARAAPAGPLRVLLVEDNAADADLVRELLLDGGAPVEVARVDRLDRALAALGAGASGGDPSDDVPLGPAPSGPAPFDAVLLDLTLPDAERLDGVRAIGAAAPGVPIVVMTGLDDERVAREAVHAGAQDYLAKGRGGARELRRALDYAVERHALRRERFALIDRERRARAAAERALRARDEVLAVVSHDLRNPLTAISISAAALLERAVPPDEAAELHRTIWQAARSALRLIRDLLDVTRLEAGGLALEREPTAAAAVLEAVEAVHRPVAETRGVALSVAAPAPLPPLAADGERLVQALGNLVANAIKFTPPGGRVAVSAERTDAPCDGVAFRVADTGPGIAPKHLPHLFDRFYQARETRRGGAGLGLPIARGIAAAHGGDVTVASSPGAGATFTLFVPYTPEAGP